MNSRMQRRQNFWRQETGDKTFGGNKEHNRKAKWINNMKKELQSLEESPEADINLNKLRATPKKVLNWKIPSHDGIHGFWFLKKSTYIHDRLSQHLSKCFQESNISEEMTEA